MKTKEWLIKYLGDEIISCQERLAKFAVNFEANPVYAFKWSNDSFATAARLSVFSSIQDWLEKEQEASLDQVKAEVQKEMLRKSLYPAQSTSPTSNLIEVYELAAWAALMEKLS